MAPASAPSRSRRVEAAFGAPIETVFVEFGERGRRRFDRAGSSRARANDAEGERDVAVKILRPGVERRFARDLSDMFFAARMAERFAPSLRRLRLVEVVETLARSVRMEMDFRLEAAAASEFAENLADDPEFRAPEDRLGPHDARSADDGMDRRDAAVSDPARLARTRLRRAASSGAR